MTGPNHSTLAVILARAGSKGLPGKNALPLAGKPLLAWTIEHALAARCVDRVVLSTDSPALADIGRRYGLEVIERPADLASDTAPVDAAARHAVQRCESKAESHKPKVESRKPQATIHQSPATTHSPIVILYGNVPLRPTDLIDRAVTKLIETAADSVQSVCPVGKMHPYWMKKLGGATGDVLLMYQDNHVYRRQDLPAVYMLDGGIIAVTRRSLFTVVPDEPHAFLGRDRRAVVTQPGEVVDIDDELDLWVAEALLRKRAEVGPVAPAAREGEAPAEPRARNGSAGASPSRPRRR